MAIGDITSWIRARVPTISYERAAARRAAVRKAVVRRLPVTRSPRRAAERRADVVKRVKRAVRPAARRVRKARKAREKPLKKMPVHDPIAARAKITSVATKLGVDFGRAAERRAEVRAAGVLGAPKQILRGIGDMGAAYRAAQEGRVEAMTARHRAKFQAGTISEPVVRFHEATARVARVARGFEEPVEKKMRAAEERLGLHAEWIPKPVKTAGWAAKRLGYGIAFAGPATAVETAGMIPVGIEAIARRPDIIPAAAAVGVVGMGRGAWEGFTTDPFGTAGEFIGFGAITRAVPKVPVPKKVSVAAEGILPTKVKTPAGLLPEKAIKFEAGLEIAKKLAHVEAPIKRPLDFATIKSLPRGSGEVVKGWIKTHTKQKPVIFGSAAARTQQKAARKPGDLDVFVKNPKTAAIQVKELLARKLGSANVRIKGNVVETKVAGKWDHAVDFHSHAERTGRMALGFQAQPPVRIGGIDYITLGEQLTRKASSVLTQRGTTIGPEPHRVPKDPMDFLKIARDLAAEERTAAESAWFLKQRKISRTIEERHLIHEYEFHAGLYPDPVIRAYARLPPGVRRPPPTMLAAYRMPRPPKEPAYPPAVPPTKYSLAAPPTKYSLAAPPTKYSLAAPPTKYPPAVPPTKYPSAVPPTKYPPVVPPAKYPPTVPPTKYPPYILPHELPPVPPVIPPMKPPVHKLPKLPEEDEKRARRKRVKAKPEWWRIENPIASMGEIMWGRGAPKKKKPKRKL